MFIYYNCASGDTLNLVSIAIKAIMNIVGTNKKNI